jgi:hypothetical protein
VRQDDCPVILLSIGGWWGAEGLAGERAAVSLVEHPAPCYTCADGEARRHRPRLVRSWQRRVCVIWAISRHTQTTRTTRILRRRIHPARRHMSRYRRRTIPAITQAISRGTSSSQAPIRHHPRRPRSRCIHRRRATASSPIRLGMASRAPTRRHLPLPPSHSTRRRQGTGQVIQGMVSSRWATARRTTLRHASKAPIWRLRA